MSQPHLPLFGILASLDAAERSAAATTLIKALAVLQNAHHIDLDPFAEDITEERLDQLCHPDVVYALKRLIRGLPSDREAARQGFSLALTELLVGLNFLTAEIILELLLRFTEIKNFMKGKEERNHMFGRIFGFMSIIQSGLLTRPRTTDDDIKVIVDDLVEYSQEKSYLSECCHQVLVAMLPQIVSHPKSIKYTVEKIFTEGVNTPDQLNVAMTLSVHLDAVNKKLSREDQINWTKMLGKSWKNPVILHPSNLKFLGLLLKEASTEDGAQASSSWSQNLHPVWDSVLGCYFNTTTPTSQIAPFSDFWNVVIDSTLFDSSSSHERKYWGFQIFEKVLPSLDEDQLPLVFTTNFMRSFVNNLSSEDRFLNKAAKHTMSAMHAKASANEAARLTLITQLLDKNPNFDRASRSKTVETLLGGLDVSHVQHYIQYLTKAFLQQDGPDFNNVERGKRVDMSRQWSVDQMFALFRNSKVPREEGWIKAILEFFLVHGFFEIKKVDSKSKYSEAHVLPSPALSTATHDYCRSRFYSMMAELATMGPLAAKSDEETVNYSRRLNGTMLDGTFWCSFALNMMVDLQKNKSFGSLVTLGDEAAKAKKSALALVHKIQEKSKKASKELKAQYKAFELLFVQMILQLYVEPEDSTNILGELHDCYDKVFASSGSKVANGKKATAGDDDDSNEDEEEEIQPVEVIIDILLSFLIKPSALLRHVSEQVFVIFCDKMTKTGLELMLSTLKTKDNKDDMFGEEEDENEEDEDEDAEADSQSGDEEDDEDESETEDMDVDEEADDDDDDDDAPVDEEFRKKLAAVLNVRDGGDDDDEDNEDSSEEELLDDDQMMAFDEKLTEIFKQKKLAKAQQRDAKQTVIHFKNKVLDLLELYIKKQSSNELVLELIVPLLSLVLIPSASNKPVHDKISALLRNKLAKIKDYPRECDDEHVFEILTQVHELAKKSPDAKFSALCGDLSLLLIKVLIGGQDEKTAVGEPKVDAAAPVKKTRGSVKAMAAAADPKEAALKVKQDRIVALYKSSLKEYMTKKNTHLSDKLFQEFIERFPHLAWRLSGTLLEFTNPKATIKSFRLTMAFTMLSGLVKRLGNKRTPEFEPLFMKTLPLIRKSLIETFEDALEPESEEKGAAKGLRVARLREILKFATLCARLVKRSEDVQVTEIWDTPRLGPLMQRMSEDARFNSGALRSSLQEMLVLVGSDIKLPTGSVKKQEKQEKRKRAQEAQQKQQANGSKKKTHRSKKRKVSSSSGPAEQQDGPGSTEA
ncbi:DNA polymerase phi-domain-containing protein [Mortierella sp. GBAus27b]|nr:DNA-directed DNA polymerase [Mortierella sp. GBA43]KAI8356351.1 DNA polymerase phi-domain-containing protein [Mortierella sp. GBAus27b]